MHVHVATYSVITYMPVNAPEVQWVQLLKLQYRVSTVFL
jgi:hypothetical protein